MLEYLLQIDWFPPFSPHLSPPPLSFPPQQFLFPKLRTEYDDLQAAYHKHLSDLESLLTQKLFEEAYAELMSWLSKKHNHLQNPDPITGKPEQVTALLARHKVRKIKHTYYYSFSVLLISSLT